MEVNPYTYSSLTYSPESLLTDGDIDSVSGEVALEVLDVEVLRNLRDAEGALHPLAAVVHQHTQPPRVLALPHAQRSHLV